MTGLLCSLPLFMAPDGLVVGNKLLFPPTLHSPPQQLRVTRHLLTTPSLQAHAIKAVLLEWRLTHSPQPQRKREKRTRESERWSALVVRCSSSLALPSFSSASVTVAGVPLSPTFTPVRYNPSSSALLFFLVNSPQFPLLHTPNTGASVLLMMVDSAFHLSQSNKKLLISGSTRIHTEFSRLRSHFLTCPRPYNFDASYASYI